MKVVKMTEVPKEPFISSLLTGRGVTEQALMPEGKDFAASIVNFGKGIRTKLHIHDCDQLLIITAGRGIVATEKEERAVTIGDAILIPAGERHWHGATKDSEFSHIFILTRGFSTTQLED